MVTLALPLLVLRFHFVNNVNTSFAANNFVAWTNLFNTGTHFHADHALSAA